MVKCILRCIQPFNAQEETGVPFHWNFNSILRRDHQKISYELPAYESVDEKSLSYVMSRKIKNLVQKGLEVSEMYLNVQ